MLARLMYASFALEESCKRINGAAVRVRVRGKAKKLTRRFTEDGAEAVAQRVAAAQVRREFRRGGAPAARDANGAATVLLQAKRARRQGCRGRRRLPRSPFL